MTYYWKESEYDRTAADKKVCNRPGYLFAAHLVAGTGGAATAAVRDGHDVGGGVLVDLAALTSSVDRVQFDPPLFFQKGLFVDVGSNVTSVLVHFSPATKKGE